jgi:hypothetical protein
MYRKKLTIQEIVSKTFQLVPSAQLTHSCRRRQFRCRDKPKARVTRRSLTRNARYTEVEV